MRAHIGIAVCHSSTHTQANMKVATAEHQSAGTACALKGQRHTEYARIPPLGYFVERAQLLSVRRQMKIYLADNSTSVLHGHRVVPVMTGQNVA